MYRIIEDLRALVQDEGTRILDDDDLIKEYIIANLSLLADEIKEELKGEINENY